MRTHKKDTFVWYVAGKMTGVPHFNVPAFLAAAESLKKRGYGAQLPDDLDDPKIVAKLMESVDGAPGDSVLTWGECLGRDVVLIADVVDGIAVLPGWQKSRGARLETFVAFLCGKPVVYASSLQKVRKRKLIKAWLAHWA